MRNFGWMSLSLVMLLGACSSEPTADPNHLDAGVQDAARSDGATDDEERRDADDGRDVARDTDASDAHDAQLSSDAGADAADLDEPDVAMQACAHPSDDPGCPSGEFGAGTFLDSIVIVEDTSCCRDFNGNGTFDNKVGGLVTLFAYGGNDINANIDEAIKSGSLVYLLGYSHWSSEIYDRDLEATIYRGIDTDADFTDNLDGTGDFYVLAESFDRVSDDPRWSFEEASVTDGRLRADRGTIDLTFPGLLDEVQILVRDARIEADVVPGADLAAGGRVSLTDGELSGAVDRERLFESMNEAALICDCLQKTIYAYDAEDDAYVCTIKQEDTDRCDADPNASAGCRFLADRSNCSLLAQLSDDADVELPGGGRGYSLGARLTGVGASLVGRTQ